MQPDDTVTRAEAMKLVVVVEKLAGKLSPSDCATLAVACARAALVLDKDAARWALTNGMLH